MANSLRSESYNQELNEGGLQTEPSRAKGVLPRRPSFASRMIQLMFTWRRPTAESRPKSWPDLAPPTATSPNFIRRASASIIIPEGTSPSTLGRAKARHIREEAIEGKQFDSGSWRQRQAHCANCERLFFTSWSGMGRSPERFCSLDCKTSFKYVSRLQEVVAEQISSASSISSESFGDLSLDEGDHELENFDAD
ncbi:hypothetical protein PF010_g19078 [Phytophthora fragariae]|uniref:FLZ-type domain-containing protein n=1 Tax=Phytophthora fragariae TaxID=53985 RepID=A0A6G0KIH0_9STRA|nr:hypothetical protein PF010_g19078 [Phytophthora fragariae]